MTDLCLTCLALTALSLADPGLAVDSPALLILCPVHLVCGCREALFDIVFGIGMDTVGGLLDAALACEVVDKSGSYYYFGSEKLAQVWLLDDTVVLYSAPLSCLGLAPVFVPMDAGCICRHTYAYISAVCYLYL